MIVVQPATHPDCRTPCWPINGEQGSLLNKSVTEVKTPNRDSNHQPLISPTINSTSTNKSERDRDPLSFSPPNNKKIT
jgi:hypothetical protein